MKYLFFIILASTSFSSLSSSESILQLSAHIFPEVRLNISTKSYVLKNETLLRTRTTEDDHSFFLETNTNNGQSHRVDIAKEDKQYVKMEKRDVSSHKNQGLHFIKLTGLSKSKLKSVRLIVMVN